MDGRFWNEGVKIVGAGSAAPYINLLPVWTVLLGILVLHEQISAITLAGGVVTILGAVLASVAPRKLQMKKQNAKSF
ncbi:DMT family transporter [Heyndrickxia acidiproducens]|uniref:DMT family transporter n=1 Tax=Heyndrickxia acidiproducens TaxID=1121084 RepID=UPI000369E1BC|nr:DMT family transporter [Heyndrickxia acidiproducens]